MTVSVQTIAERLCAGGVIPYLGPALLALCPDTATPATPLALAEIITAKVSVQHKIRTRLTRAAQFIENFKHRKSLVSVMNEAFAMTSTPSALHCALAAIGAGLVVDNWYDDTSPARWQARPQDGWAQLQGLSQAEHFGHWFAAYSADGALLDAVPASGALLYKPIGGRAPASNYLVSDSDFVEVMTEIDIQTPIPPAVQAWRSGRSFLFLGFERRDDRGRIAGGRRGHRRRGATRPRAGARTACAGRFRRGHRSARARGRPC
ncbi:SIR2 family protein [Paraburkholderia sp. BL25I1N1]|uniref:SIR2 family protein n=1 Tax=Paraburkholderia sp. BL25I1N1 TaxID=1938804 RepID=UPI000D07EFD3|nr:SIR2 family protein [Paraburkholderia sp. BL25I1N1]PRX92603.1 SIR2-like protein [Paraburkholderia sp. BL25I1N1]